MKTSNLQLKFQELDVIDPNEAVPLDLQTSVVRISPRKQPFHSVTATSNTIRSQRLVELECLTVDLKHIVANWKTFGKVISSVKTVVNNEISDEDRAAVLSLIFFEAGCDELVAGYYASQTEFETLMEELTRLAAQVREDNILANEYGRQCNNLSEQIDRLLQVWTSSKLKEMGSKAVDCLEDILQDRAFLPQENHINAEDSGEKTAKLLPLVVGGMFTVAGILTNPLVAVVGVLGCSIIEMISFENSSLTDGRMQGKVLRKRAQTVELLRVRLAC